MNKLIVKEVKKLENLRKVKFRQFERIAQGHPPNGYAAQCQSSCFCFFTRNFKCFKSYRLQAEWPDRDKKYILKKK